MSISIKEIESLPVSERIDLVEQIWDSIPEKSEEYAISPSDKRKLDRRLDKLEKGEAKTVS